MLMINITMLVITFVNSTISKSISPANYSSAAMPFRATVKTKVQRQYSKDDGSNVSLVHRLRSINTCKKYQTFWYQDLYQALNYQ